jgi:hypothetical protein
MPPSCHPCTNASNRKSFGGLSPHPVEERTNTKTGITKNCAKLQYRKYQMLIEIKGYTKPIEHQFKKHMGYDGRNEDEVNPNEKHQ